MNKHKGEVLGTEAKEFKAYNAKHTQEMQKGKHNIENGITWEAPNSIEHCSNRNV